MKVILLEDVKGSGKKGQVIEVSDGHARNFLLPRKLAVEANDSNMNALKHKKRADDLKAQKDLDEARELVKKLEETTLEIAVKIGENGKLFGSVTNKEIALSLEEKSGIKIDKKKIILAEPVKTIGEAFADIKLHPQVSARVKVNIVEC